ncbi:hypothetical protein BYT27DRAFT_7260823 [Phlegmacium glaucopus]|nr:hypothetical protein BYT27DRAFT_7260823 [Phlegmacium glaucopus]
MANTTPVSLGSNLLNSLVESHVGSDRDAIKTDFFGKIVYDDPAVFRPLQVNQVDNNFVATRAASFKVEITRDIDTLSLLVKKASKETPDVLEEEEYEDKANVCSDSLLQKTNGSLSLLVPMSGVFTAWRSIARASESNISLLIDQPPGEVAKFECGGDVWSVGYPITAQNLHCKTVHDLDIDPPTLVQVLHRLVLATVGRPLWEYILELELLTGFRSALQAHKALCDRGILHSNQPLRLTSLFLHCICPSQKYVVDFENLKPSEYLLASSFTAYVPVFTLSLPPPNSLKSAAAALDPGLTVYRALKCSEISPGDSTAEA